MSISIKYISLIGVILGLIGCPDGGNNDPMEREFLKVGRSLYAIQNSNFDCEYWVNKLKENNVPFNYAWLYYTFDNVGNGANLECVYRLNALDTTNGMEIHLINEVCQRNGRCGSYEFLHGMSVSEYDSKLRRKDGQLMNRLRDYIQTAANRILPTLREHQSCYVSPGLESNLSTDAAKVVLELSKEVFGHRCKIVWNPLDANPISGYVYEQHHNTANLTVPCIANTDGQDISFPYRNSDMYSIDISQVTDYVNKYQHCDMVYLWVREDNCIGSSKPFVDPRNRTNCNNHQINDELYNYLKLDKPKS